MTQPDADARARYAAERAERQLIMTAIRRDLEAHPSPSSALSAARRWCADITAMADGVAQRKRSTG